MNRCKIDDYRNEVEKHPDVKDRFKNELTKTDSHLSHLATIQLLNIQEFLMEKDKFYTLRWLSGWNRYLKDKSGYHTSNYQYNYQVGSIVLAELFGNFNPEFSYPHPVLIVKSSHLHFKYRLLVVPMTSSKDTENDANPLHIPLLKSDGMLKDSLLKLEDMRVISTSRVIKNLNIKINGAKRKEINAQIVKAFFGNVNNDLDSLKSENKRLLKRVQDLESQLLDQNGRAND